MVEDDIYNNKGHYERFLANLDDLCHPCKTNTKNEGQRQRKYWIQNPLNKGYFLALDKVFKARDTSYIRRMRLFRVFIIVCHFFNKDLKNITDREEIDLLMGFANDINISPKSKRDFAIDVKYIWRKIFPERDERGRVDDTIFPYVVRHLSGKVDKSQQRLRGDRYTPQEFRTKTQFKGRNISQ
jgi:hypothetical protein